MISIMPFGSCRIFDPLNKLAAKQRIKLPLEHAYWYTHSSGEAIQRYKILTGQIDVPNDLRPFVFEQRDSKAKPYSVENYSPSFIADVSCFFVEVSTMKAYERDGIRLQMYVLQTEAQRRGFEWQQVRRFMRTPIDKRGDAEEFRENYAQLNANFGRFSERRQTPGEIKADLSKLRRLLPKPMVLIGHFNLPAANGQPFPERVTLNATLEEWATEAAVPYFDPTVFHAAYGMDGIFSDVSHYAPDFLPRAAERFAELLV